MVLRDEYDGLILDQRMTSEFSSTFEKRKMFATKNDKSSIFRFASKEL